MIETKRRERKTNLDVVNVLDDEGGGIRGVVIRGIRIKAVVVFGVIERKISGLTSGCFGDL